MPIRSLIAMLLLAPLTLAQDPAPPLFAADTPIIDYQNPLLPSYGRVGMVVSPEKLAGEIGLDMLRQGGNAIDAAVATGFALAVTCPVQAISVAGALCWSTLQKPTSKSLSIIARQRRLPPPATCF